MDEKLLSLDELSAYMNISKSTLYKLVEKNQMPSCKIGKQLRFRQSTIDRWLSGKEGRLTQVPAPSYLKPKRILLIEDDQLVAKAIARLLKAHGYNLELAYSGEEAVEKAKNSSEAFGLIITDIRMPGIDGIETLKRIRQLYRELSFPSASEIVITGYTDGKPEAEAQNLGITDFLYKPFVTADFMLAVEKKLAAAN